MRVQADWLIEFAHSVLKAAGTDEEQAAKVAEILVWSDLIGRHTQGVWRLPTYCKRVRLKLIKCPCRPSFEDRGSAVCVIDGDNGFGFVISALAMERAIALIEDPAVIPTHPRAPGPVGAATQSTTGSRGLAGARQPATHLPPGSRHRLRAGRRAPRLTWRARGLHNLPQHP
jgi:hypothetical protein